MFIKLIFTCLAASLFITNLTQGQINLSRLSINAGWIRNQQKDFGNDKLFTFYPELQAGGILFSDYFEWGVNLGYWDDGIDETFLIMDAATYSYSSFLIGSKIIFIPKNIYDNSSLPIHFILGLSYHLISQHYVGGLDFYGEHRNNKSYRILTYNFGAGINYNVMKFLRLRLDGLVYRPFKKNEYLLTRGGSSSLMFGCDYIFD